MFAVETPGDFSPVFALSALFHPAEAHHVKFMTYDLKTLIATCIERQEARQLERTLSSKSDNSVAGSDSDEDSRLEFRKNILSSSMGSQNSESPMSIADKYLIYLANSKTRDAFEFWKGIGDDLVILHIMHIL